MRMVYDEALQDDICIADKPIFRVSDVKAQPDYTLLLTFSNGERRCYDASQLFQYPLFAPLQNLSLFMQAHSDGCAVAWNDDIDIAPESLYQNSTTIN